jgi:Flp pilus assembly protein TadG
VNERGQTTVLVLGMALLAFAVAGLAVDGTRAWLYRRTLQNAADAAALAGASELDRDTYYGSGGEEIVLDEAASRRTALGWLTERLTGARVSVTAASGRVVVEMRGRVGTTFLSLAGIRDIEVAVRADAAPIPGTP